MLRLRPTRVGTGLLVLGQLICGCDPGLVEAVVILPGQVVVPAAQNPLNPDMLEATIDFSPYQEIDIGEDMLFNMAEADKDTIIYVETTYSAVELIAPEQEGDLDFIDDLTFRAQAEGLPGARVAYTTIDGRSSFVTLRRDDFDFQEYFKSPTFRLDAEVTGVYPELETTVRAELEFRIIADRIAE